MRKDNSRRKVFFYAIRNIYGIILEEDKFTRKVFHSRDTNIYGIILEEGLILAQSISFKGYEIFMGNFKGRINSRAKWFI